MLSRKVNLWGPWEQSVFARSQPGGLRAVDLRLQSGASLRLGILICYDVEFPEPSRCLAVQGAELLLVPTALGLGEVESATPFRIIPSRALENHVFVAYCNLEGPAVCAAEQGVAFFCGKSALVGPDGEDIVRAGANVGGQMLSAELRLDR